MRGLSRQAFSPRRAGFSPGCSHGRALRPPDGCATGPLRATLGALYYPTG
jgi:hypothetical protein